MKKKLNPSRYAQNRIEYIIYGNPKAARNLLYEYGYEIPENIKDVAKSFKLLIQKKGRKIIKDLILIHPEKDIILKVTGKSNYSSFCGACSAFAGDEQNLKEQIKDMSTNDLKALYERLKKSASEDSNDKSIIDKVELAWDEITNRKEEDEKTKPDDKVDRFNKLLDKAAPCGIALLIGIVIGGLAFSKTN